MSDCYLKHLNPTRHHARKHAAPTSTQPPAPGGAPAPGATAAPKPTSWQQTNSPMPAR